jgi:hypothetical protein
MASFESHIEQAKSNLSFLEQSNKNANNFWDWQVTVSFYVGVHLVNAHIAQCTQNSYRSHEQVDQAINPYAALSVAKLTETNYLAYSKLQGLARRARYLCHEDHANKTTDAQFTYDKHFARAVRNLDVLMAFLADHYRVHFPVVSLRCLELRNKPLRFFAIL